MNNIILLVITLIILYHNKEVTEDLLTKIFVYFLVSYEK